MNWEIRAASGLLCLAILLTIIRNGNAERKIVCYYTNWSVYRPGTAKFSPQNINPYLCTHLIYAFGGFTKDNALRPFDKYQDIEKGGYAKFNGLKTYNKNLKTMLAIGGWNEGSSRFSPMVADPSRRREFVKNSIKFLRQNHFDGLDLDWEYPAFRDGGKPRDKDNYASLVQELREEFERESSKTGRPRLLLSMAVPAGTEYIDKGYDIPKLNEYLDFFNLLSYDYHSAYEPAVNHHSPLYPIEEDNEYNFDSELTIDHSINHLLKNGASSEKIVLGIPTYGRSYTLYNEDATELGSPADGPGVEGDATREKGYLAYYEICEGIADSDDWEVVQPNAKAMGPYAVKGDQWVGYDDEAIVRVKAKYANDRNLGGIMFWSIDNDDFRGKCHDRPYPLIEAAKEALLTGSTNPSSHKSKHSDSRKKLRPQTQSNGIGRKLGSNRRTTTSTTAAPVPRKRVSRPKYKTISRPRSSEKEDDEEEREEEDKEVDRRSYDPYSEEEDDEAGGNVVRTVEKTERARPKVKKPKTRSNSSGSRRKQTRRKQQPDEPVEVESLSNKLTTPEPPTTPDPGSDFKCEDEGFFSHPRDCKKYFWCLDSGPGGLGVVAHQFTCPSGLVFNKAADSCDYPRNVVCPKTKTAAASTTRAPITAATSRTTYLHSTTSRSTTEKDRTEEEYEYYDDDDDDDEDDQEESEEEPQEERKEQRKEQPRVTTTAKPLLYKTINRSRPTTSTTTSTTTTTTTTPQPEKKEPEKASEEDEEDPRVIKELIELIRKAGGLDQLEKQVLFQEKSSDSSLSNERATPATISRSLYERVLSRQANKIGQRTTSTRTSYANGPGGAQFEGLDEVPEVKTLRRSQKPKYVTIERPKPSRKEPTVEEEEDDEGEDVDEERVEGEERPDADNTDVASSEERTVSNPFLTRSTQRATPSYVNIRRNRPSTTTSKYENDVEEKEEVPVEEEEEEEEEIPVRRRRPTSSSKNSDAERSTERSTESPAEASSRSSESAEDTPTTKSRYVNIHRFRSTTAKSVEETTENVASSPLQEPVTEPIVPTVETTVESVPVPTTPVTTSTVSSTTVALAETTGTPVSTSSTSESVKLVEESATEILLSTAPASSPTTSAPRITVATVSQPRPFGFSRRNRPTDATPSTPSNERSKVASYEEAIRLPTLRELIGYRTTDRTTLESPVYFTLLPSDRLSDSFAVENETNYVLENEPASLPDKPFRTKFLDSSSFEHIDEYEKPSVDDLPRREFDANAENDVETSNRKRKARIDRGETTFRPTTMRGTPLADLFPSQATRGFYVTRTNLSKVAKITDDTETDGFAPGTESTVNVGETIANLDTGINVPTESSGDITASSSSESKDTRRSKNRNRSTASPKTTTSSLEPSSTSADFEISSTDSTDSTETTNSVDATVVSTLAASSVDRSTLATSTTLFVQVTPDTVATPLPPVTLTTEVPVIDIELEAEPTTESAEKETEILPNTVTETTATPDKLSSIYVENTKGGDTTELREYTSDKTTLAEGSNTTTVPSSTVGSNGQAIPENKTERRRNRIRFDNTRDFGQKVSRRTYVNRANSRPATEQHLVAERRQYPRRRVGHGTRRLRPVVSSATDEIVPRENETTLGDEPRNITEHATESSSGEERSGEKGIKMKDEIAQEEESSDRPVPEVTTTVSSKVTVSTSSIRLRKPSKQASGGRSNRPVTISTTSEKYDTTEGITEAAKSVKDIDQSSRAQELAVTLADPPTGTGRLRDVLRRRISTTVSPRTESTTIKPAARFTNRQKPKTGKDRPRENATVRPRRPVIVDYDYYEDEDERIVGKSTVNGKLFLTSQGSIRCLDQGNFPHPYSCKKFITCARMVNGQVIGAEYTCPDKLSFDPIGGICNWSAGLGCQE